jgi:uncharacterized protein
MPVRLAGIAAVVACATPHPAAVTTSELRSRSADPVVAVAATTTPAELADATTRTALDALVARDFTAVAATFDPAGAPTAAQIAAVWTAKTGGLGRVTGPWTIVDRTRQDGFETRIARLPLERGELHALASIANDRIASLFLSQPAPAAPYVDATRFQSLPVVVGNAPYPLDGTLAMPAGTGPFPAVVLVHGSGPNDRDASVGSNKIFKDLAEGLASAGIAVVRYDKRTFAYGDRLTNAITIDDEVVHDAIAATRVLAAHPKVDPQRVFVVGHSLGGQLAPEIAVRATGVAGIALLAPPGRPPWDIVSAQMRYLHAPREALVAVERAIIDIQFGGTPDLLGIPFTYWRDWAARDGVAMARTFGRPVLVLHGDRDYQVTAEDFATWRTGLAGRAELVTIRGANHLFIRGTGTPGPAEYKVPGHVDEGVVARLVAFVTRTPPLRAR